MKTSEKPKKSENKHKMKKFDIWAMQTHLKEKIDSSDRLT